MPDSTPCILWHRLPPKYEVRLDELLAKTLHNGPKQIDLLFRADDIGAPGKNFDRLMGLFSRHRLPLCLAVVPTWLTEARWQAINGQWAQENPGNWCWHQHGWLHANHQQSGKKCEFGDQRPPEAAADDIQLGRRRLQNIMGSSFFPAFTPPWNRLTHQTIEALAAQNFPVISRFGSRPQPVIPGLIDLPVNIDLHTRKEQNADEAWKNLFDAIADSFLSEYCGIMIHHQRMNDLAFQFLDTFLSTVKTSRSCRIYSFENYYEYKVLKNS